MLLGDFNLKQKQYFLSLAILILKSDNKGIDEAENQYLRSLCMEMSISLNDASTILISDIDKIFENENEKKIVLIESMALALSNNEYHELEKTLITEIALKLGLIQYLGQVENLLKEYFSNRNKIVSFIYE